MLTVAIQPQSELDTSQGLSGIAGLRGAVVRTGVKPSGALDLALLVAEEPMSAVGVFTRNAVAAAPVSLCRERLASDARIRSIVINSGNANALTGAQGFTDAERMIETLESRCGGPGLVMSTGVIGVPLPVDRVCDGIERASESLTDSFEPGVPEAILTTDKRVKMASTDLRMQRGTFRVGGVAKGSGMIHPNMATMLAVVATDAPADAAILRPMLGDAVDASFHEISVDGDTSTNDAVVLLARQPWTDAPDLTPSEREAFEIAVTRVCRSLADQIVADGEGATRVMDVEVCGAASVGDANAIATSIACSALVKTALAGGDPNWGRILAAAGNAGVALAAETVALSLGDQVVFRWGEPAPVDAAALRALFAANRVAVRLDVGMGEAVGRRQTTDFSKEYVAINADYTT
jgi:glutamate N-acetyltransferase/amino-acid N-acetyltransferase